MSQTTTAEKSEGQKHEAGKPIDTQAAKENKDQPGQTTDSNNVTVICNKENEKQATAAEMPVEEVGDKIEQIQIKQNTAEQEPQKQLTKIEKLMEKEPKRIIDWAACSEDPDSPAPDATNSCAVFHAAEKEEDKPADKMVAVDSVIFASSRPRHNIIKAKPASSDGSTRSDGSSRSEDSVKGADHRYYNTHHVAQPINFDNEHGMLPMYEFEVPNTLVGLIIGIRGKTIKELCTRAEVRILIRPHHDGSKINSHQICSIEGKRDDINKCLHMMRHRFPPSRFPDLNLKPVFPPPAPSPIFPSPDMMELALPAGAMFEAYVSAPIDAGHFFVQLPTHPTFPQLRNVDDLMYRIYNHSLELPDYVRPPKNANNMLCAAPASNGWFRSVAVCYDEKQDEMLVKFVDYGGFARVPRADLRFLLRPDLLSLPFQSIECHIADVEPIEGSSWSAEANALFQSLCTGKIIQAELIGHSRKDGFPVVRLYVKNQKEETIPFYQYLIDAKMAKPWDPDCFVGLQLPKITITKDKESDADSGESDATLVSPEPSEESKKENHNTYNGKTKTAGYTNANLNKSQPRRDVVAYR